MSAVSEASDIRQVKRTAVIGLDGGTFSLLDPFMASGVMPNLVRYVESGTRAVLNSTRPPITACAWPTMYTGVEPGRHSVFDFRRPLRQDDLKRRFINSSSIRMPKVWEILAEEGAKSILLNLPLTYPPFEMQGQMVSGMPLPSGTEGISYPAGLMAEIEKECGGYISDIDFLRGEIPDIGQSDEIEELLDQLGHALELRLKASLYLMSKNDWRLFFCCFILPDRIQHLYYMLLDEESPEGKSPGKDGEKLREQLIALYGKLDDAIGELTRNLGEEDSVLFVSDHGFGPLKRIFHLNSWLKEKGYLNLRSRAAHRSIGSFLPEPIKAPLRKLLGRNKSAPADYNPLVLIDWENTRCFSGSSTEQGVYINVKGREPYGVVEQGFEYIKFRDELIKELANAVDPETGEKVFDIVAPREEIQSGRFLDDAPDIFIQPKGHDTVMAEEHVGPLSIPWHHPWGGFHREEGIFIASGRGINRKAILDPIEMTGMLPIILHTLGLPVPSWVSPTLPEGLFVSETSAQIKDYPELLARYEDDESGDIDDAGGEDLLKGLGYIN